MSVFEGFSESTLRHDSATSPVRITSSPLSPTPTFSVVIPALNEETSLPILIQKIESTLRGQFYEVIFVDDGSTDGTWREMQIAVRRHRTWQAIRLSRPFGHQAALAAGLSVARGRAVITMDADGQHPPEQIPKMLERWREGFKVVQMIREEGGSSSLFKRATSRLFYRTFSALSDVPIRGAMSDFRLLDRSVVDVIIHQNNPVPFLRGLVPWLGHRSAELGYVPMSRLGGETKFSLVRMFGLALHGITNFSVVPLRLATYSGITFASLSFLYLCYIAWIGLFSPAAVSGWASTAGLVALLGGVQLICIGVLGEYLGRVFTAQMGRPGFVIADRCGASGRDRAMPTADSLTIASPMAASAQRRSESVRLITAHIGEAETDIGGRLPDRINLHHRIESMRREEASYAPLTT